jgi:hypothetical protein
MSLTATNLFTIIDNNCGTNTTSYTLANKAININLGIDQLMLMLFGEGAGGTWQLDDSNHTDYPIITTNLVASQRDYSFTTDENGNIILDIYKVQVMGQDNVYRDLTPVDQQGFDKNLPSTFTDGQNSTGTPTHYDKTGNGIFLDLIPSYSKTNGLRLFINREASYFTSADTTKKLGFTGLYHEYVALYASYQYARAKSLENREALKRDMTEIEQKIKKHAGTRQRDVIRRMKTNVENNR